VLLTAIDEAPVGGNILDLGCGWGPIALALGMNSPKATIWAVDTNKRSLDLTEHNANKLAIKNIKTALPDEISEDIQFSGIWSNPPIRIGKEELHQLLLRWVPRLAPGGEAFLVVKKDLGADSLHRWLETALTKDFSVTRFDNSKGYRILQIRRES
jgi:16S rRNA G1207 methylase RsmC